MAKSIILNDLMNSLGLNINSFEAALNVSNGRIRKAIDRNSNISTDLIDTIVSKFPNVNKEWLLTGKGDIFTTPAHDDQKGIKRGEVIALGGKIPKRLTAEDHAKAFPNWKGVPVYNVEVSASFVSRYSDEQNKWEPLYYLRDPQFRECDFAARISGDSMHSEIRHGDYIICQEIQDREIIIYGEIYYVVTSNGLETCKYVNAMPVYSEDKDDKRKMYDYDRVLLVPKNDSISPTPLHKKDIIRLYKVKGIVRGY